MANMENADKNLLLTRWRLPVTKYRYNISADARTDLASNLTCGATIEGNF
jgi:hypothetical protein